MLRKGIVTLYSSQDNNNQRINELKSEIGQLYNVKTQCAQIRSSMLLLEEGEKNTKYFVILEKSRQHRKWITSLTVNNKTIDDEGPILQEIVKYYEH